MKKDKILIHRNDVPSLAKKLLKMQRTGEKGWAGNEYEMPFLTAKDNREIILVFRRDGKE